MRAGIEIAFAAANDAGGVNGRKLRLTALDDGYDPARTLSAMTDLVVNRKVFLLQHNGVDDRVIYDRNLFPINAGEAREIRCHFFGNGQNSIGPRVEKLCPERPQAVHPLILAFDHGRHMVVFYNDQIGPSAGKFVCDGTDGIEMRLA